jgi:imidazolonepropionase-like amidohydrolase
MMMMSRLSFALAVLLAGSLSASTQVPAKPQDHPIALMGATIHPVSGPEIPNGTLLFEGGRIIALGAEVPLPEGCERLALAGRHVYPGMINASTALGLTEIGAVRATEDLEELGLLNPSARAEVAVNPDSELIPVARANGVALALAVPQGGLLAGRSALLRLDGWTWEEMALKAPAGMHLVWPSMTIDAVEEEDRETQRDQRDERLRALDEAFAAARAYQTGLKAGEPRARDARWEALVPVLEGKLPLMVHAREIRQIQAAVAFVQREKVRMVLFGGTDAPRCAGLLARLGIPVVVEGTLKLPQRPDDPYDSPFTLPERLRRAGLAFCIASGDAWNARNLPYHAAQAAAYGLPREEALKAVTLYPARILGVADRVGSLDVGKDATLIVTTGDPLEIPTQVEMMFIEGRRIDLSDKQKQLWEKYRRKPAP